MQDKGQDPKNPACIIPPSEPFRCFCSVKTRIVAYQVDCVNRERWEKELYMIYSHRLYLKIVLENLIQKINRLIGFCVCVSMVIYNFQWKPQKVSMDGRIYFHWHCRTPYMSRESSNRCFWPRNYVRSMKTVKHFSRPFWCCHAYCILITV